MAFFPHQHAARRGAKQVAVCSLCDQLVDVTRLIESDVQGLRGFWVCDQHPWEERVRFKPSYYDRGGTGQVVDPGYDYYPAPGNFTFFESEEDVGAGYLSSNQTILNAAPQAVTELSFSVVQGKKYWFRAVLWASDAMLYTFDGTASATAVTFSLPDNGTRVTSLGTLATTSTTSLEFMGSIDVATTGSVGLYARENSGSSTLYAGSYIIYGQIN